jgi:hypothetical protein
MNGSRRDANDLAGPDRASLARPEEEGRLALLDGDHLGARMDMSLLSSSWLRVDESDAHARAVLGALEHPALAALRQRLAVADTQVDALTLGSSSSASASNQASAGAGIPCVPSAFRTAVSSPKRLTRSRKSSAEIPSRVRQVWSTGQPNW